MQPSLYVHKSRIPAPAETVFDWHTRRGALERLTPPWERVQVLCADDRPGPGSRVALETRVGPLRQRWLAEHVGWEEGRSFRDVQVEGPFASWDHTHLMQPEGEGACVMEDRVEYRLPGGALGRLFGGPFVRRKLERMFEYRHAVLAQDLANGSAGGDARAMKVAVTGATGLVGSALVPLLGTKGHEVRPVSRRFGSGGLVWDPETGALEGETAEGLDAFVHLAGESIASGRWTEARKQRIRDSRVDGTRKLCETLAKLERKPEVLVCASAIGFYGDRGDELLDESSSSGAGFLAEVCREWERATEPAREAGIRVVNLRFGVILSPAGGALAKMLPPFRAGAGGRLGAGEQWMSWIAIDDAVGAIRHALTHPDLAGPVNAVAPNPATNADYTRTLGRVLKRPTIFPVPAFAARLAFGEMADEMLLASTRVRPAALEQTGYRFRFPDLEPALRHVLGRRG
jgi:uncharacterized protein (TIGR01777 family)